MIIVYTILSTMQDGTVHILYILFNLIPEILEILQQKTKHHYQKLIAEEGHI